MGNFNARLSIIDKFAQHFKGQFSKKQFAAFSAILYALINEYKHVNISSLAKALDADYEKLVSIKRFDVKFFIFLIFWPSGLYPTVYNTIIPLLGATGFS